MFGKSNSKRRDDKLKSYIEMGVSGMRNEDLSEELFEALRDRDLQLAAAIWQLGTRLDRNALAAIETHKITLDNGQFWKVPPHVHVVLEYEGSTERAMSRLKEMKVPLFSPLGYFCATGNAEAVQFLMEQKVNPNEGNDHPGHVFNLRPAHYALAHPNILRVLIEHGAVMTDNIVNQICLYSVRQQSPDLIALCLEGGGNIKIIQETLGKLMISSGVSSSYVSQVKEILTAYEDKKKTPLIVKPAAAAGQEPGALDPNEVIFETAVMDRCMHKVFNFAAQECVSMIRRGATGPVESHETKRFCDLIGQPDLKKAFAEHNRRGGTMTEDDIQSPSASKAAPVRRIVRML